MKLEELKKLYEEARTPYRRIETIEKLSLEIKNNNDLLLRSIEGILEICQNIKGLRENISLCSNSYFNSIPKTRSFVYFIKIY